MAESRAAMLRRLWLNLHLWIGVGLALLLIPISISGGLLVWHDEIDTLINPQRYAVSGPQVALPASAYIAKAEEAIAGANLRVTGVRYPDPGWPVRVVWREQGRGAGGPPRFVTVFLDPPTAAVLDVMEFRSSFIGFLHVFHENLMIPQYSGRQIVGWAGVGMLILSLTGIWLWWPRNNGFLGGFVRGLRWTRSPRFTFNLHNMLGFWISIPLAVVSLTGIYLSFPQTARDMMVSIAPMNPNQRGSFFGEIAKNAALTPDQALDAALKTEPNAVPATVFLPVQPRGERAGGPSWRIQLTRADGETTTVMVDDRSGATTRMPAPKSGDRAASWIRWIHEGSHSGFIWAVIVFLTGVFPTIFAITGVIMWLRKRADRKRTANMRGSARLHPAE